MLDYRLLNTQVAVCCDDHLSSMYFCADVRCRRVKHRGAGRDICASCRRSWTTCRLKPALTSWINCVRWFSAKTDSRITGICWKCTVSSRHIIMSLKRDCFHAEFFQSVGLFLCRITQNAVNQCSWNFVRANYWIWDDWNVCWLCEFLAIEQLLWTWSVTCCQRITFSTVVWYSCQSTADCLDIYRWHLVKPVDLYSTSRMILFCKALGYGTC